MLLTGKNIRYLLILVFILCSSAGNAQWNNNKTKNYSKESYRWSYENRLPYDDIDYNKRGQPDKADSRMYLNSYRRSPGRAVMFHDNYEIYRDIPATNSAKYKKYKRKKNHTKTDVKTGRGRKIKRHGRSFFHYRIKRGDTLYKISRKYGVSISAIVGLNRIRSISKIIKGRVIKIPRWSKKIAAHKKSYNRRRREGAKRIKHSSVKFKWPVKRILKCRRDGIKGVRSIGIIITGRPGSPVFSSASGVVKKIGRMRGFGKYVIISHNNRYITVYSNLAKISVREGMQIRSGSIIGRIGNSENKIHFQIGYEGKQLNPLKFLPDRS